jgi:hypothetical protein
MNVYEHIKKSLNSHGIPDEIVNIIKEYMKIVKLDDIIDNIFNKFQNKKYIPLKKNEIKEIIIYFKDKNILLSLNNWWSLEKWNILNNCFVTSGKKNLKKIKRTYLYIINKIILIFKNNIKYVDIYSEYKMDYQFGEYLKIIKNSLLNLKKNN